MQGRPLGRGRVVVVMVHGRNASPDKILTMVPALGRDDVTYLAPAAEGGSWYPQGFMAPTAVNEPGITNGIAAVHACIAQAIAAGVSERRIVLLGFSQGACLAGTAAVRRPARYGGVVMFSGGLIGPPGTAWPTAGSFDGTPVFLGCSDPDGHIPADRVRESAAHFTAMGAKVTMRLYPNMGHLVSEDELEFARAMLADAAG
ncbi:MAG: dienelactone hydrolase family protein [Gemmatimonadetes bacterium]|nr:dienelactone hydrolase family protein [Gemmatimonadota bacterium]